MLEAATLPSLLACVLTGVVVLASLQLKLTECQAYRNWVGAVPNRPARLFLDYAAVPLEVGIVAMLAAASLGRFGAEAATATSLILLAMDKVRPLVTGTSDCACFGRLSLNQRLNTTTLFSLVFLIDLGLMAVHLKHLLPQAISTAGIFIAWLSGFVLTSCLLAASRANGVSTTAGPVMDESQQLPALPAEFALLLREEVDFSEAPVILAFGMKGCGPCKRVVEPLIALADAFPTKANYFLSEYGEGESIYALGRNVKSVPAPTLDLARFFGVNKYPSVVRLENASPGSQWTVLVSNAEIRSALAGLII